MLGFSLNWQRTVRKRSGPAAMWRWRAIDAVHRRNQQETGREFDASRPRIAGQNPSGGSGDGYRGDGGPCGRLTSGARTTDPFLLDFPRYGPGRFRGHVAAPAVVHGFAPMDGPHVPDHRGGW